MAISTTSNFTKLSNTLITDEQYFIVSGWIQEKRLFKVTLKDSKSNEIFVGSLPLPINDPSLLEEAHDLCVSYLQELNPTSTFTIIEL